MANENYLDKLRIGGVDRPVRDSETEGRVTTLENKLGANSGIATLGADGKVQSSQLPSYVDDAVELLSIGTSAPSSCEEGDLYYNSTAGKIYEATGTNTWGSTGIDPERGKIYVNLSNNKSYRWSGSTFVQIDSSDVTGIKVGASGSTISPSQGVITLPEYEAGAQVNVKPDWNAASGSDAEILNKPTIPAAQVQADWNAESGMGVILNKPSSLPANGGNAAKVNNHTVEKDVPSDAVFTDHTYSTMGASGSGHAGGLVPDTPSQAGTTKYLREDGIWVTPPNDNTTYDTASISSAGLAPATTAAVKFLQTNASGVPSWGDKPSYAYPEIGYAVATASDNGNTSGAITLDGAKPLHVISLAGAATSVAFTSGKLPEVGHSCHVIFTAASDTTVSLSHVSSGNVRYICPAGEDPDDLEVPAGGYVEIDLLRAPDTTESNNTINWIYVRGI